MLRCAGQRAPGLHHDQECSGEGEEVVLLRTNRQSNPQLPATCCPNSFQMHASVLSTSYQGKKKKKRSDCLQVFWLHVKVFFSASSVEIKQFLFTIITSAFSQLCARVRA